MWSQFSPVLWHVLWPSFYLFFCRFSSCGNYTKYTTCIVTITHLCRRWEGRRDCFMAVCGACGMELYKLLWSPANRNRLPQGHLQWILSLLPCLTHFFLTLRAPTCILFVPITLLLLLDAILDPRDSCQHPVTLVQCFKQRILGFALV